MKLAVCLSAYSCMKEQRPKVASFRSIGGYLHHPARYLAWVAFCEKATPDESGPLRSLGGIVRALEAGLRVSRCQHLAFNCGYGLLLPLSVRNSWRSLVICRLCTGVQAYEYHEKVALRMRLMLRFVKNEITSYWICKAC